MTLTQGQRAVVIDASATIEFLFGQPRWVDRWQSWIERGDALLAPVLFPIEVANALLHGSRRLRAADAAILVRELAATGVEVADRGWPGVERAIDLAERHDLTVYDAAYLDLAIDVDGALATLDRDLGAAATAEGVEVLG